MSIYGIKPTFVDYDGYRAWRKVWKEIYSELSERIRDSRSTIRELDNCHQKGTTMSEPWKKLKGEKIAAFKLNTILEEAKIRMNGITKMQKGMVEHQNQFPLEIKDAQSLDFHFNKKHLEFSWMPMWVVKTKGRSFYVMHVEANAPWTTRETPDHSSTKGSLRFRRCDLKIDAEGVAYITPMATIASV